MNIFTFLKEEIKEHKKAAKNLKKHWKEIQNIKKIEFGDIYTSFKMHLIHRHFNGTNISLLAIFAVYEFLHNLNTFIDDINRERIMKSINEAAGAQICGFSKSGCGVSSVMPTTLLFHKNSRPFMIEYYISRINNLKKGNIEVRPEIWNYIFSEENLSDTEKKEFEKQVADEALNILKQSNNIIRFIENLIEGNYNFQ